MSELERMQRFMNVYRAQAEKQAEAGEKNNALELSEAAASQVAVPSAGHLEPAPSSEHLDSSLDGQPSAEVDVNADSGKEHATMDIVTDGSMHINEPLVVEDKGDDITQTLNKMSGDAATSSEVATESINPDSVSTKQESIQEKIEATEVDNSCVLGGDTAENQTGMEE